MLKKADPMRSPDPMRSKGGRPRKNIDILQIIGLRWAGHSWREIASQTGLGRGTVHDAYRAAVALLSASENHFGNSIESTAGGNSVPSPGLREESRLETCDG